MTENRLVTIVNKYHDAQVFTCVDTDYIGYMIRGTIHFDNSTVTDFKQLSYIEVDYMEDEDLYNLLELLIDGLYNVDHK